jgi:hypothetical protein
MNDALVHIDGFRTDLGDRTVIDLLRPAQRLGTPAGMTVPGCATR